ncbi:neutral alpha-glucosidase C-like [Plectropomus leopardus]|nr:neutral alpha-glucosidase C-like [Plectropomus leopardus]
MLSGRLLCRPAASEGAAFDCETVVQSVTVLGLKSKPSTVLVHVSGEDTSAAFEYSETCSSLTVGGLKLRVATDWDIKFTG